MNRGLKLADKYNLSIMTKGRLNEVASLLEVAIWRQFVRERDKLSKKILDSRSKWSVTPPVIKHGG